MSQSTDADSAERTAAPTKLAPYPAWLDRFGAFLLAGTPSEAKQQHRWAIWQLMLRLGSGLGLVHPRSAEAPIFAAGAYFSLDMDGGAIFRRFKQWLVIHGLEAVML